MSFNDTAEVSALIGVSAFGIVWGIVNWLLVPNVMLTYFSDQRS